MENSKVKKERKVKPLYWFITAWAVLGVAFGVYAIEIRNKIALKKIAAETHAIEKTIEAEFRTVAFNKAVELYDGYDFYYDETQKLFSAGIPDEARETINSMTNAYYDVLKNK